MGLAINTLKSLHDSQRRFAAGDPGCAQGPTTRPAADRGLGSAFTGMGDYIPDMNWGTTMGLVELDSLRGAHPVDLIEHVAHVNEWAFERAGDDEIAISVAGAYTDYHVSISWMEDHEALHLACAFDIRIKGSRQLEIMRLLSRINEQLLFGHFDLWEQEGAIMYRQSLLLSGGAEPNNHQVEMLLTNALEACETYFQAFQFVNWSGVGAREALDSVMFETQGNC